jgi:16S rRNA (guanine527-N7)-methyltransferase
LPGDRNPKLQQYLTMLEKWNRRIPLVSRSLVARGGLSDLVETSLRVADAIEKREAAVVDVGSGAGFPGIPLALARPDLKITLVEPTLKKAEFLREVVSILKLSGVSVVEARVEAADLGEAIADYITVRALRIDRIEARLHRMLKTGGVLFLWQGREEKTFDPALWEKSLEIPAEGGLTIIGLRKTDPRVGDLI